ncbi:hypothetical protein PVL29_017429 [Vitis rotundifolia]|uniref:Uncharacterized protein n=1 Tax=Vitis rotundifolia TaxID=103349 RepID=A0AA39DJ11_VITRO|nr:hypothetical protein PVL29_017429 [Vitis rotundifolia]
MALCMLAPNPIPAFPRLQPPTRHCSRQGKSFSDSASGLVVQCPFASKVQDQTAVRRSANYQPSIWDYDYIQSLRSNYVGKTHMKRLDELKGFVKMMLIGKDEKALDQLETIDLLQRLGVSYHFEDEIKSKLDCRYKNYDRNNMWKGASYFSMEGESVLDEARDFTKKHLEKSLEHSLDKNLARLVSHSLELPLHWRMLGIEARWFMDIYERRQDMDPSLLEFAKLDYNMVQAIHQEDLKDVSKWWKNIGLGEQMSFTRDRLVENFLWAVGHAFEPQFGYCRKIITKVLALIVTIDDIYDIYGTLDELEIFTDAVDRWDINAMDQLPEYMKMCFLALFNSVNEMAYNVLKEEGSNIIPHLRKMWADLCKCYLVEARWYYSGYTPTLQEYITNGLISSSAPAILGHASFSVSNPVMDAIEFLEKRLNVIHGSSMILWLSDDLGTSKDELKRGDVPKSIQCYMHQTGASQEEACELIKYLIGDSWKKMNKEQSMDSPFSRIFIGIAMNVGRMGQRAYLYGDGYGVQARETKDDILLTLIESVPLNRYTKVC